MQDTKSADWKARVLRAVDNLDGTDIYGMTGKSPIWGAGAMAVFKPLIEEGLLRLDESELPISRDHAMGLGFVIMTEAGRAFRDANPIGELKAA